MAESVGVLILSMKVTSKKERKGYFLSKNSQKEVCSTVSSDINDSLADISDFSEDFMSETGSDSGKLSVSSARWQQKRHVQ